MYQVRREFEFFLTESRVVWEITTGWPDHRAPKVGRVSSANRQVLFSHSHQPTRVPITLFRCRAQPLSRRISRTMGWGELARGDIHVHDVPGYHGEQCQEPYVQHWVGQLAAYLSESEHMP